MPEKEHNDYPSLCLILPPRNYSRGGPTKTEKQVVSEALTTTYEPDLRRKTPLIGLHSISE